MATMLRRAHDASISGQTAATGPHRHTQCPELHSARGLQWCLSCHMYFAPINEDSAQLQ